MKDKVKICAIGCGGIASTFHYPSLTEMKDVELAALCEISEERLKIGMDKFGFKKGYYDYKEMLGKEKPDAVYVILHPLHSYSVLEHCYQQKYDVFSEKPPALTTFQTRVLAEIVKRNKNITQIGYQPTTSSTTLWFCSPRASLASSLLTGTPEGGSWMWKFTATAV